MTFNAEFAIRVRESFKSHKLHSCSENLMTISGVAVVAF